jgi:hypothetical protein
MALRLGDIAPYFTQVSAKATIHTHDLIDGKCVLLKVKFLKDYTELRPYLRMTPQPNKIMAESRYAACAS